MKCNNKRNSCSKLSKRSKVNNSKNSNSTKTKWFK